MLTYVFPGQGSQFIGMGEELLEDFRTLTLRSSDILGYDIKELCVKDPENKLSLTQYTQPAIFVVSALAYLKQFELTSKKSDFVAGHSLGEYAALFAAGIIDFETGLKLVKKRGELMSQSKSGAMAAVLGATIEEISEILSQHNFDKIEVANFNSPVQIVLSGSAEQIDAATNPFENAGIRYIRLPVSAAFHSSYMKQAQMEFAEYLQQFNFKRSRIPVIANSTARPYQQGNEIQLLSDQITHSVRWTETIDYLYDQGNMDFLELGPGQVLTGLIEVIKSERQTEIAA
ncbi:polyketide biosynthesis malonyl-CoA-[acyl-carrier-protein] transacylase/trans-AT polyketide synthase/acyltransferase/oxidoreductase domain-containing protein [Alteromonadaceae bacterium 2753L.S.0a.02]|nr:polyketide biosynthesis malonyl-CoA-[acyl-carrier-protein] transacylase/trans-AT polyketide synthase/acyltransferase/oxidoreductase domain-containing protein [Alteromonadaceae bacterium 2753L.S.0a.02]